MSPERANAYTPIRYGDVLFAASGETIEEIGKSSVNLINSPAVCGGDVLRFTPAIPMNPRFLGYACDCPSSVAQKSLMGRGFTVMHIYGSQLKSLSLALPPLPEQAAIVRFLDHADRRIRRYIRAKQKLIKLLEELKAAIIHRAVTRGLDPKVRLKPSGVEWLGDVPEHWEVRRLKYLAEGIQMGPFGASLTELQDQDTGYKLFGQENTISGDFSKGGRWLTRAQYEALRRYELLPGDLVLTRKGSIGKCKMVPSDASTGIADSDTIRVRLPRHLVSDGFVVALLEDAVYVRRQIESVKRGAILAGLNTATIGNLRIAVPPLVEQHAILAQIEADIALVSGASLGASREMTLLREYRTRLIADVVTGKLDVRETTAALPEVDPLATDDEPDTRDAVAVANGDDLDVIPKEVEA